MASGKLRKRFGALIVGLLLTPLAALATEPPPLIWAADAEGGAPYIYRDPADPTKNVGFEVDLAAALARQLGRRIEHRQYDYKSLFPGLERGDFDFAMNGLELTPDRRARYRWSRPYYIYRLQLVGRKGEARFRDLAACAASHGVVATLEETAAERLLDQMGIAKRIYDSQIEPYRDLELGRVDAVLMDLPIAVSYARPNPALEFLGTPVGEGVYAIALRKSDEALGRELDRALGALIESGELQTIYEGWSLWDDAQAKLAAASIDDVAAQAQQQWTPARYLPLLVQGAIVTVEITLASMLLAVLLGLPISLARLYGAAPLRWAAVAYVEFFRGIPVLLLLYFLYYGLPTLGGPALDLGPLGAAILGFGLNYAAYEAEIYRAGIASIPPGQWEAAASLGMPSGLTFRKVILPQAIRVILPPMTNDFVALFKDTSIVSVIAVVELSKQYQILSKSSLKYLEIGLATAALYLVLSVPLGLAARRLEARWSRGTA